MLGLAENVAREQLSAVEEARAYAALLDEFELSLGDVAERVGRSKPAVSNRIRLLELPEDVLELVAERCPERGARARRALAPRRRRPASPCEACRQRGPQRPRDRARSAGGWSAPPRSSGERVDPALAERARSAAERVMGLPARVSAGRLEVHFADETRLAELVEALEAL